MTAREPVDSLVHKLMTRGPASGEGGQPGQRPAASSSGFAGVSASGSAIQPVVDPVEARSQKAATKRTLWPRPGPAGGPPTGAIAQLSVELSAELADAPHRDGVLDPPGTIGRARLGELLPVPLTQADAERVGDRQRARGMRFGEVAVELGLASQADVDWALSRQYGFAWMRAGEDTALPELVQARQPFGAAAEAFRDLRAHLMNQPELAQRALAVVSAQAGDGRSFVAANLAIAFSQLGAKTLLIDADLRRPRQHLLFGLTSAHGRPGSADSSGPSGLAGMLSGRAQGKVLHRVPQLPGLHLLPAGAPPPNPLELLQRPTLDALLGEVVRAFDFVVVDTPPVVHLADARVIAAACGAALAVARKDHTAMADLHDIAGSMAQLRAHFAGVVFNPA